MEDIAPSFGGAIFYRNKPKKQKGRASPTFHYRFCYQCQYIRGQSAKTVCVSARRQLSLSLMSSLSSLLALVNFSLTGEQYGGSSKASSGTAETLMDRILVCIMSFARPIIN
ncbi:hypothetical protein G6L28_00195 [Agrobacterium larrymoorei]|uniref:hypothetical protein n=1 Tax=Agrobacterium larrymoorei TaxID=160699 RepID=UPI001574E2F6|nr:hypothetical protein [Agrobacterium larrymoorei]NTJ41017.1 hypothetical protein [Agrobacterium larrymoorei]